MKKAIATQGLLFEDLEYDALGKIDMHVSDGRIEITGDFDSKKALEVFELETQLPTEADNKKKKKAAKDNNDKDADDDDADDADDADDDDADEDGEDDTKKDDDDDEAPEKATPALAAELNGLSEGERSVRGAYTHLRNKGFSPEDASLVLRYFKQTKSVSFILRGFNLDEMSEIIKRVEVTYSQAATASEDNPPKKKRGRPRKNPA